MAITFYPKSLFVTAVFIVAFGSMLSVATDLRRGVAAGVLALSAYLLIEVFVVVNPAMWWRTRRRRQHKCW